MSSHGEAIPMIARRSSGLSGEAHVPGDKSISHRSLILGAMAVGETRVTGLLEGQDVLDTAKAMRAFGAEVEKRGDTWHVNGVGVGGFAEPEEVIDCGNSGTGVRLIMGAMATTPITATFTGDASLSRRPMARVTDPLSAFGAQITAREGGRLPITIQGAADPVPLRYRTPVASAQIKSAILLAGLNSPGETVVIEAEPTRDHSERMLAGFGAQIRTETTDQGHVVTLAGRPELRAQPVAVPRDPSSAAFPVAAALIVPGSASNGAGVVEIGRRAESEIRSSSATMIQFASNEEPPAARNGVVRPMSGINLVTPPMTTKHCSAIAKESPQASSFPKASRVPRAARKPRVINSM